MKRGEGSCNNSCGITSVILGIIGSVLAIFILPIIISITGLVFGIVQYRKAKNAWAIWGIILSALGILIAIYVIWQIVVMVSGIQALFDSCMIDPTAPGCEQVLGSIGGTS